MDDVEVMQPKQIPELPPEPTGPLAWLATTLGRVLISLFVPILTFLVLWQGFLFLRNANAPQLVLVLVAIIWGVGGVALLFLVSNWLVEQLPGEWTRRLQPFVFVGPGVAILSWYLAIPTLRTLWLAFQDANSTRFVGLDNFVFAFTDRVMLEAFRNNLLWMVFGTAFTVG
jgi:alpha-glucoside transport system permease protein